MEINKCEAKKFYDKLIQDRLSDEDLKNVKKEVQGSSVFYDFKDSSNLSVDTKEQLFFIFFKDETLRLNNKGREENLTAEGFANLLNNVDVPKDFKPDKKVEGILKKVKGYGRV